MKGLIDKDHNYEARLSMCSRVKTKALHAIIGDYKGQFGQMRDFLYEIYKKNPGTPINVNSKMEMIISSSFYTFDREH